MFKTSQTYDIQETQKEPHEFFKNEHPHRLFIPKLSRAFYSNSFTAITQRRQCFGRIFIQRDNHKELRFIGNTSKVWCNYYKAANVFCQCSRILKTMKNTEYKCDMSCSILLQGCLVHNSNNSIICSKESKIYSKLILAVM